MNKNNDKFNDQVKRNVEELHKLKEDVKKTDDPKIKRRIKRLNNKKVSMIVFLIWWVLLAQDDQLRQAASANTVTRLT